MVYATNLKFSEQSGLGLRVIDENVGTGDNSETSFDLDHDNVISEGYSLYHAASGSNDMTGLTETTHYTLDKESGRILLTTAGKTALGTDILYASYWYTDVFSDSVITNLLSTASAEVDKLTGKSWSSSASKIEYFDGRRDPKAFYPTTDRPFMADYDPPPTIMLNFYPVINVNNVYFLNDLQSISTFFNYDNGTSAYTSKTSEVNDTTSDLFTLFDDSPAVNDIIYVGSGSTFLGLRVYLSTLGTGSPEIDWEYYNGTSWTDLTETETDSGSSTFEASGEFTWTYPYDWSKTSVNSENLYWIRGKLSTGYTISPVCASMTLIDSVNSVLEPRQLQYRDYGELSILGTRLPDGTRNIRVDYTYGMSSTPDYIVELEILLASVKAYVNLSGGSYDAATRYALGSKDISIGEQYVNIREVIDQFRKRINEILGMVGKRAVLKSL